MAHDVVLLEAEIVSWRWRDAFHPWIHSGKHHGIDIATCKNAVFAGGTHEVGFAS
jgi:hypothetical protein